MIRPAYHRVSRLLILALTGINAAMALAQEQMPVSNPTQAASDQGAKGSNDQGAPVEAAAPSLVYSPTLDQPGIRELGGNGGWFSDNVGLFRWGPVAVRSAEALYNYSSANPAAGTQGSLSSATLQANVAYTRRLRRSRLVLQYNPRLLYDNGVVSLAAANQETATDLLFAPAPHLTIGFSDGFSFHGRLNTFNDKSLSENSLSGSVSNPFLNGQQQTWLNSFAVPITYSFSARTTILVSPLFNYVRTSDSQDSSPSPAPGGQLSTLSMFQYGIRTQVTHTLSPNQSVGMFYTYQMDRQTGIQGNTSFHSLGATASRRLGRTMTISAEAGGSHSVGPQSAAWTAVGSASITKAFRRSSLQGTYGRDATFTGLLGSDYNNRAFATYSRPVGRRVNMSAGAGYLSGLSLGQKTSGKYFNNRIDYGISSTVGWSFGYVHFWQGGQGPQLVNGQQSQLQFGLRWTPPLRPGTQ